MPEKKAAATKKPVKRTSVKKEVEKKIAEGDTYVCGVCGLSVKVERIGNIAYAEGNPIICCSKVMKKKTKAKAKAA